MNLNRRDFLRAAVTGAVGAVVASTLDLEQLLWEPGKKAIFDLGAGRAANEFNTPDWVIREHAHLLRNNLAFANVNRSYDHDFKVGDRLSIRIPQRYERVNGGLYVPTAYGEREFVVTATTGAGNGR